jgi:hypothetical protein
MKIKFYSMTKYGIMFVEKYELPIIAIMGSMGEHNE